MYDRPIAFMLGFMYGLVVGILLMTVLCQGPYCPTEDSCRVDYNNGSYHIIQVQP